MPRTYHSGLQLLCPHCVRERWVYTKVCANERYRPGGVLWGGTGGFGAMRKPAASRRPRTFPPLAKEV